MSESGHRTDKGVPVADIAAGEAEEDFDQPVVVETEVERARSWKSIGFHRMRFSWRPEDRSVLETARSEVDNRLFREFKGLYLLLEEVYDVVRKPATDDDGTIMEDRYGRTIWAKDESGRFVEDFSVVLQRQKEDWLFKLTTQLVFWQQKSADAWGEAMLAKVMWTEHFSEGFDSPKSGTDERRKAQGNLESRDDYYFAIFSAWYSKKADLLVRSAELLGQRLKDSLG